MSVRQVGARSLRQRSRLREPGFDHPHLSGTDRLRGTSVGTGHPCPDGAKSRAFTNHCHSSTRTTSRSALPFTAPRSNRPCKTSPGFAPLRRFKIQARGITELRDFVETVFEVSERQILRLENDRRFPERGSLQVET